jgi:hypothetical protein
MSVGCQSVSRALTVPRKKRENNSVWTKDEMHKEEVRGVIALGAIAALIAFKTNTSHLPTLFDFLKLFGMELPGAGLVWPYLSDLAIGIWFFYITSVAFALSDDVLPIKMFPRFVKLCKRDAPLLFVFGNLTTAIYVVTVFWYTAPFLFALEFLVLAGVMMLLLIPLICRVVWTYIRAQGGR